MTLVPQSSNPFREPEPADQMSGIAQMIVIRCLLVHELGCGSSWVKNLPFNVFRGLRIGFGSRTPQGSKSDPEISPSLYVKNLQRKRSGAKALSRFTSKME